MKNQQHRKLFYVPGMISLVLLPVICLWFLNSGNYLKEYRVISIGMADSFSKFNYSDPLNPIPIYPKRKIENFVFNGNAAFEKLQLVAARKRIKRLFKENDSIHAVKIILDNKSSYQSFIDVLDAFSQDAVPTYLIKDNYFFIVYFSPENKKQKLLRPLPMVSCGYAAANRDYFLEQERKEQQEIFIKNNKRFWQIPLALFGMMVLNIYTLIKFNHHRKYNQKSYI